MAKFTKPDAKLGAPHLASEMWVFQGLRKFKPPNRNHLAWLTLSLALIFVSNNPARAQGCTQCRDNAAATSVQTQAAYRHAIELLVVTAGTLFVGTVFLLRRTR